ncbi:MULTISPECIES: efflux RND transporter permease subunit [Salinibaculum]|uniref:efflux RND transporter permease subunit n=1 Tax=Salinibaculum TaxID=2732368 RepID=UPI0030D5E705
MLRRALQRSTDFVTKHNRIVLLVMVLLTAGVLAGIPQIDMASQAGGTTDQFQGIDRVEKSQYIQNNYTADTQRSNRSVRAVYVRDDGGNVLSKESLLAGLRYQQSVRDNESVAAALHGDGIVGLSNLVATRAAGDRGATLSEQIRALERASASEVERLVERTLSDDPRAARFLPADHDQGSAAATDRRMLVTLDTRTADETRDAAGTALYDASEKRQSAGFFVVNADAWADYRQHFFGEMVELVLPVALLLVLLVLAFAYRDLVDVVVGMSGVLLSVLWMFGLLGWLGVEAGTMSIVPVVLITGLSIDFGFHVFNRYREQRGEDEGIREPMSRGVRLVATALVLVTVTAAIGFMANVANPLPVIRDLGITITLGVVSALVLFATVVPALKISIDGVLERVGIDRRKQPLGHGRYLRPVLGGSVTLARRAAPVVLVVAVLVGAAGGVAWASLDKESYQQSDGDVAEWKQQLPGPVGWETGDVPGQSAHIDEVYQPASAADAFQSQILVEDDVTSDGTLEDVAAGVQRIEDEGVLIDQPGTQAVRSPVTAMQAVARQNDDFAAAFQRADTNGNGVPDTDLESLYDAFYAANPDVASQVLERTDGEYRSLLVTMALNGDYSEATDVVPELEDGAAVMEGEGARTATAAGGLSVQTAVLDEIVGGIIMTMVVALAAVVLTLTLVFRYMHGSATLGAVVSVPIVLVVGLVIGGMYLLGIPLTLLTALLMSLVIGMGVDYNIHVGDRFADELRAGKPPIAALQAAVTGTGGALLGSTLTSAGAFATISLVPQAQLQSFGAIVVIALVTAFLASVLVLPSLLLLWSRYSGVETPTPDSTADPMPQD